MTQENEHIYQSHFTFALNFFQLVENVLIETVKHDNIDLYFGEPRKDIKEQYRQITKWSDFKIFIPVLFNFFHAIELLLKGANYKIVLPVKDPNHNLTDHYQKFKDNYANATVMIAIFSKYIFLTTSDCKILKDFKI